MPDVLQLPIQGSPLPGNFSGTPQEFFEAILDRIRVIFPTAQFSFVISDDEPSSNQGPWLKEGLYWYVWSDVEKRYIPVDITPSWPMVISETQPTDGVKYPIWVRIAGTRAVGFFVYIGGEYKSLLGGFGTTAQRPATPLEYERYFDTDINTGLIYYGTKWRTFAGSPNDLKFVATLTLAEALKYNPGWTEVGMTLSDSRGRAFVPADKDVDGNVAPVLDPRAGYTTRAAFTSFGEETHTLTIAEMPSHSHTIPPPLGNMQPDSLQNGPDGGMKQKAIDPGVVAPAGGGLAHNNLPPTIAFWCLRKDV